MVLDAWIIRGLRWETICHPRWEVKVRKKGKNAIKLIFWVLNFFYNEKQEKWKTGDDGKERNTFILGCIELLMPVRKTSSRMTSQQWVKDFCRLERQLHLTFNWFSSTLKYICFSWGSYRIVRIQCTKILQENSQKREPKNGINYSCLE